MASLIDNGTFSFNPEEVKDYSGNIQELTYNNPLLTEIHDIETGIVNDKQIVFSGKKGLMSKNITGCVPPAAGGITMSQKFWRPKIFGFRMAHCQADVNLQDKLVNQWTRVNPDYLNIVEGSGSATGAFLVGIVQDALPEDILTKAWFSDTLAATFTNSGNFTNGTDLTLLNTIDGLWKQIFTEIPAPNVSIAKNAGNSYANQTLIAGEAVAVFKGLYNKADSRLRGQAGAQFLVTRSLYDGLLNDIEDKQFNAGFTQTVENGKLTLTYRGIKVVMVELWDRVIAQYQNNGTVWFRPHRAVLTVKNNIPIGTPDTESLGKLDAFYDRVSKQNYIDAEFGLDAKMLETYLTCVAY